MMTLSMPNSSISIVRYTAVSEAVWDNFVFEAKNGSFLFRRSYMDYHANRFSDFSWMFYKEGKLVALLPGHISQSIFYSHCGLTYGGFILSNEVTLKMLHEMFYLLIFHLKGLNIDRMLYRAIPHIYHIYPAEEDLCILFLLHAKLIERKISSVVIPSVKIPFQTLRKRKSRHALKSGLSVCQDDAFYLFWPILLENLQNRHNAHPVHTLREITYLQVLFPNEIKLYRVIDSEGITLGGCVLYLTQRVAHVQYIGSNEKGRKEGAIDLLFDKLINEIYSDKEFFDLGRSVEDGGYTLNSGLIFQKEGFGGRAVMYDTYELELNSISDDQLFQLTAR